MVSDMTKGADVMTDFQFKTVIKMIRQTVAAKIAAHEDPSEILDALDELLGEHSVDEKEV
ncbi:hypothetical protein FACS1894202_00660 [Clostridia bacterium]|nr:hypothetical protein FACS1894202_00660 [Clostridia bacterium]